MEGLHCLRACLRGALEQKMRRTHLVLLERCRPRYQRFGAKEKPLSATRQPERRLQIGDLRVPTARSLQAMVLLSALALSGCGEKPQPQAAAPPPVTVAQPVKRTVTDWDEFTGRFEAVEEVQVRARVGGFVTNVEFKDGDMVHAGDLLYIIDPRPFEAVATQADGQLADARAKAELAKRDLERGLTLVQTSAVSEQVVDQRRQALQAAHAAKTIAEGALKAAQLARYAQSGAGGPDRRDQALA